MSQFKRVAKTAYIIGMPVLYFYLLVGMLVTVIVTGNPLWAIPWVIPLLSVARFIRICMVWMSTPSEYKTFQPDREPLAQAAAFVAQPVCQSALTKLENRNSAEVDGGAGECRSA